MTLLHPNPTPFLRKIFLKVFKVYVNKICACYIKECHFWSTEQILAFEVSN